MFRECPIHEVRSTAMTCWTGGCPTVPVLCWHVGHLPHHGECIHAAMTAEFKPDDVMRSA